MLGHLVAINMILCIEGHSRSVIQDCGCDQEGRKLSWETKVEEVGFVMLPKRCNRGTVSYIKGERVPEDWGIVTKGIRELFDSFVNSTVDLFIWGFTSLSKLYRSYHDG